MARGRVNHKRDPRGREDGWVAKNERIKGPHRINPEAWHDKTKKIRCTCSMCADTAMWQSRLGGYSHGFDSTTRNGKIRRQQRIRRVRKLMNKMRVVES